MKHGDTPKHHAMQAAFALARGMLIHGLRPKVAASFQKRLCVGYEATRSGRSSLEAGQRADTRVRRGIVVGIALNVDIARVRRVRASSGAQPPVVPRCKLQPLTR